MIINVTDTYKRAEYVDIISANIVLLEATPPPVMITRGDMIGKLRSFLIYIRDHGSAYIYGKHYTGVSIRKLAKLYGGSWTTWEDYIHAWIEWGLLGAPDHSVTENNIFEINAKEYARLSGDHYKATTMYTVTRWTAEQLASLPARKEKGSGTKANAIHRLGQAEADRIYGDRRGISHPAQLAEEMILYWIEAEIRDHGYCTRGALRQKVQVSYDDRNGQERRIKVDPVFDDMRPEIEKRYRYGAPTAELIQKLKDQYGAEKIRIKGRQWILTRKEDAPERATASARRRDKEDDKQ